MHALIPFLQHWWAYMTFEGPETVHVRQTKPKNAQQFHLTRTVNLIDQVRTDLRPYDSKDTSVTKEWISCNITIRLSLPSARIFSMKAIYMITFQLDSQLFI